MAGAAELQRLFRTFLGLKKTCEKVEVSFSSDCGNCNVVLRVKTPRADYQTSWRGSGLSRSQRGGPSVLPPPPAPQGDSSTRPPSAAPERGSGNQKPPPSPAPGKRSRKRGPSALFRNERRRLGRIQLHVAEVEGTMSALPPLLALPPPLPAPLPSLPPQLASRVDDMTPSTLASGRRWTRFR